MNRLPDSSFTGFILVAGIFSMVYATFYEAAFIEQPRPLNVLYTQGNSVIDSRINQSIVLRGVTSDYFRYGMNKPALYGGIESEFGKIEKLKQAGANINVIGLYLARLDEIRSHIEELDRYINYALNNNMYVYLAPTGNAFPETMFKEYRKPQASFYENYFKNMGTNDLAKLTELLASRYGTYPHVLYYLTAEPNIPPDSPTWYAKQEELAAIVRKYTDNPILVATPFYSPYPSLPILPYHNIIYTTGGYLSKDDNSRVERRLDEILWTSERQEGPLKDYPVLVAEFGGNYGGDFLSDRDLGLLREILEEIHRARLHYTVYRLSSAFENDGLALFDTQGELTAKGKVFIESF